jgi:hypothetical protein
MKRPWHGTTPTTTSSLLEWRSPVTRSYGCVRIWPTAIPVKSAMQLTKSSAPTPHRQITVASCTTATITQRRGRSSTYWVWMTRPTRSTQQILPTRAPSISALPTSQLETGLPSRMLRTTHFTHTWPSTHSTFRRRRPPRRPP